MTDDFGRDYTINVFTLFRNGKPAQPCVDSGLKELETADGQMVLRIGPGSTN